MTLHTFKAQPIGPEPIEDLTIVIAQPFPSFTKAVEREHTLEDLRALHDKEGQALVDALVKTLPGGTVDALLRHLLLYRASLLVVRF